MENSMKYVISVVVLVLAGFFICAFLITGEELITGEVIFEEEVVAMTEIMRRWDSYEEIKKDTRSVIALGESADFVIINLDLMIKERTNVSGIEVLEIIRGGEIIYESGL